MRTFLLLVFACVVVTESKADNVKTLLLKECIDSTRYILHNSPNKVLDKLVKKVFENQAYSEESPCQAAAALKCEAQNTELGMLQRRLSAYAVYTGHQNCTVADTGEYFMKDLLKNIIACCRTLIIQQKKHR